MKKLISVSLTFLVISSCTTTKEAKSARNEVRKEKKIAEQEMIKNSIESRRYIINLDRLYFTHGGIIDLVPRNNYFIINGEKATIRAGYIGRQFDIRPIAGIRMSGEATKYELKNDSTKGIYKIKMKVNNRSNSFDIQLTIDKNGSCRLSVSNNRLDYVTYSGHIVPMKEKAIKKPQETIMI